MNITYELIYQTPASFLPHIRTSRVNITYELIYQTPASSSTTSQVCVDKNGLFFTGDTCQTIARGVGFRFEELTSLFHHLAESERLRWAARGVRIEELPRERRVQVPEVNKLISVMTSHVCDEISLVAEPNFQVPEVNKLTVNYRTHNGILGAAAEVVRLLLELFPHSVDALQKDVGARHLPNMVGTPHKQLHQMAGKPHTCLIWQSRLASRCTFQPPSCSI